MVLSAGHRALPATTLLAMTAIALAAPAEAASRGTRIAMAVAIVDVAKDTCRTVTLDEELQSHLMRHFHEYDIGGLASAISGPLNAFYEDFQHEAKSDPRGFCAAAADYSARTGYPVILGAE